MSIETNEIEWLEQVLIHCESIGIPKETIERFTTFYLLEKES